MLTAPKTSPLTLVWNDLALRPEKLRLPSPAGAAGSSGEKPGDALAGIAAGTRAADASGALLLFAEEACAADGRLFVLLEGARSEAEIASLRNAIWPAWHVGALYEIAQSGIVLQSLDGRRELHGGSGVRGVLVCARRRAAVFAPEATVVKFDRNASGWNGSPGTPGYAHFRWMRRFVADFGAAERARRILDFGCGAGWVGIEAALRAPSSELCAFDPSAEMVKLAAENARAAGITRFAGRTGFGEDPPFPAEGEEPFDLVYSSGVVSFSGEPARWLDGLVGTLAPGATLVIGDINRDSLGMRARRARKALLPVRELNAWTREELRAELERRGLTFEAWTGYQRTSPLPEAMHWDATRLGGVLSRPLLWVNRASSALETRGGARRPERFDSWVMRFSRGGR